MRNGLIFLSAVASSLVSAVGVECAICGRGRCRVCPVTLRCRLLRFAVKNGLITTMPCHLHTVARTKVFDQIVK